MRLYLSRSCPNWPAAREVRGSALRGSAQPRKSPVEILLQVLDVLEADLQPQARAPRSECGCGAVALAVEGDDEALEATPGIAHGEELEAVEHGGDGLKRHGMEHHGEQA